MSKVKCQICDCDVPVNSVGQHNSGKKHKYYSEIYEKTGNYYVKPSSSWKSSRIKIDNTTKTKITSINDKINLLKEIPLFNELEEIFPEKINPFMYLSFDDKKVLEKVLLLMYNILFDFDEEIELDNVETECVRNYLFVKHKFKNSQEAGFVQKLEGEKIVSLFISSIRDDYFDLSAEIQKIVDYNSLNILIDNDDFESAETQIQENYKKDIENYLSIYKEAKTNFEISKKRNDFS